MSFAKHISIKFLFADEMIAIELVNKNNLILSRYESNVNQFLFPKPLLRPKYSRSCRSLLMDCNLWSIAPKLEFQTNSKIIEEKCNSETDSDSSAFESMDSQEINFD